MQDSSNEITGRADNIIAARDKFTTTGDDKFDASFAVTVDAATNQIAQDIAAGTLVSNILNIRYGGASNPGARPMDPSGNRGTAQGRTISIDNVKILNGKTTKLIEMNALASDMNNGVVLKLRKEADASATLITNINTVAGYNPASGTASTTGGGQVNVGDLELLQGSSSDAIGLLGTANFSSTAETVANRLNYQSGGATNALKILPKYIKSYPSGSKKTAQQNKVTVYNNAWNNQNNMVNNRNRIQIDGHGYVTGDIVSYYKLSLIHI